VKRITFQTKKLLNSPQLALPQQFNPQQTLPNPQQKDGNGAEKNRKHYHTWEFITPPEEDHPLYHEFLLAKGRIRAVKELF
jgi:hypothetical protein